MGKLRQIHFGIPFHDAKEVDSKITMANIFAPNNLFDADVIGLHLDDIIETQVHIGEDGIEDLDDVLFRLNRIKNHLIDILDYGKKLFIFCKYPLNIKILGYVDEEKYGEIHDPITLQFFFENIPDNIFLNNAKGINIDFHESIYSNTITNNADLSLLFEYNFIFPELNIYEPLFTIKDTDFVVGLSFPYSKGKVYLLPALNNYKSFLGNPNGQAALLSAVGELLLNVKGGLVVVQEQVKAPSWISNFHIMNQNNLINAKIELEGEIQILESRMSKIEDEIAVLEGYKSVTYKTGNALEIQIISMFKELGYKIETGKVDNRVDAIIEFDDGRSIVIEIKGVKGSASEKNSAQLEKWSTEYYSETKRIPKGLLIINTFKDLPVEERNETNFPPQMLKFMNLKNQVGMSALTFLDFFTKIKTGKLTKEKFTKMLINSKGIIK